MKNKKKITIIAILLFIALLIIIGISIKKVNIKITEDHKFYQYFFGRKVEYNGKLILSRENKITELTFDGTQIDLDSTPIYYADVKDKLLLPEDMAVVFPNDSGRMQKINRFSNIQIVDNVVYVEENKKNRELDRAFLYDGSNLYLFLDKTTLKVNEDEYVLSPLSYVDCGIDLLEIYQKAEDKYTTVELKVGDSVTVNKDGYTINLNVDSIKTNDTEQLLIRNKDFLEHF